MTHQREASKLKNIALGGLFSLFALVTCLGVLEVGIRLLPEKPTVVRFPERPERYYLPEDSNSMRGNVFTPEVKQAGEFRIGVVGDSFTFAPKMQFDDAFPFRLQRMLRLQKDGRPISVISYGTPGFSTELELRLVQNAIEAKSDLILLQITLNDAQKEVLTSLPGIFDRSKQEQSPLLRFLFYSRFVRFVAQRIDNYRSVNHYIKYHQDLFNDPVTWNSFAEALRQMKGNADAASVQFAAVLFPLFDFPIDEAYPFAKIHQKILAELANLKIPALDLRLAFSGLDVGRLTLIPGKDSHPNEIAHRIAADAIYAWLANEQLLPPALAIKRFYPQREGIEESSRPRK